MQHLDAVDFLPLAHKLAYSIQWSEEDHDDLVQEGLLELTKQFAVYQAKGTILRNPLAMAAQIMSCWMKDYYKLSDRTNQTVLRDPQTFDVEVRPSDHERFLTEFLVEVERMVGPLEAEMAEALLWGTPESAAKALEEHHDKQRRHAEGESVRGVHTVVHKHEHIRLALELGEWEWEKRLKRLRLFTRSFLARTSTGEPEGRCGHDVSRLPTAESTTYSPRSDSSESPTWKSPSASSSTSSSGPLLSVP
jgi:hypothetical protein